MVMFTECFRLHLVCQAVVSVDSRFACVLVSPVCFHRDSFFRVFNHELPLCSKNVFAWPTFQRAFLLQRGSYLVQEQINRETFSTIKKSANC